MGTPAAVAVSSSLTLTGFYFDELISVLQVTVSRLETYLGTEASRLLLFPFFIDLPQIP